LARLCAGLITFGAETAAAGTPPALAASPVCSGCTPAAEYSSGSAQRTSSRGSRAAFLQLLAVGLISRGACRTPHLFIPAVADGCGSKCHPCRVASGGLRRNLGAALNRGAQADARGATQVLGRGGQAAARGCCLSQVLGRGGCVASDFARKLWLHSFNNLPYRPYEGMARGKLALS
jgi:hypothetical protein